MQTSSLFYRLKRVAPIPKKSSRVRLVLFKTPRLAILSRATGLAPSSRPFYGPSIWIGTEDVATSCDASRDVKGKVGPRA
jgi:hypothetical protein